MSMKPGLMPIKPNDARSAIRAYKTLESDIVRIRQDMISKRVCDVEGARFAIQRKQRQLQQLQNWMRQYHIQTDTFDKLEAQRREQAMRKQQAIFETKRREVVPVKGSAQQKAAVHAEIIESTPAPIIPPSIPPYVPAAIPVQKVEYSGWEFTTTPPMKLLRMIEESTEVEDIQYIQPALPPTKPALLVRNGPNYQRHMGIIQGMLEALYKTRNTFNDKVTVYQHLDIVYGVNRIPTTQRLTPPIKAQTPSLPPPSVVPPRAGRPALPISQGSGSSWIEEALTNADWLKSKATDHANLKAIIDQQRHRVKTGVYQNIEAAKVATERLIGEWVRQYNNNKQAVAAASEEASNRGEQALLEQTSANLQQIIDVQQAAKEAGVDRTRLEKGLAQNIEKITELELDLAKQKAHEQNMIRKNEEKVREEKKAEAALKAKEQAAAIQKQDDEFKQMEQVMKVEQQQDRAVEHDIAKLKRDIVPAMDEIKVLETQIIPQLDREMQHAKMYNPEVMQDMAEHRTEMLSHLKKMKRRVAPSISKIKGYNQAQIAAAQLGGYDNTAGLRAWHKNLFTKKSTRDSTALVQALNAEYDVKSLPTHIQEKVRNVIANYEYGKYPSQQEAEVAIETIFIENNVHMRQAQNNAAALGGTPRHIKYAKASVLPNNYQRLRQLQQGEEVEKAANTATKQVAEQKAQLAGMFPKLRDSVTRMVGH
jgi:hypothetical protein